MSDYFGQSPDGYQKPLYGASNLSDVVDKPTALVNLGAASADDVLKAANPIGTIIAFYGSVAPYGYLPCSGQTVSSSTFPSLVTFLGGTTSATLPDLRGEFLRGWDNGRGVDTGRAIRSFQLDAFQGHRHAALNNNFVQNGTLNTAAGSSYAGGVDTSTTTGNPVTDTVNGTPRVGTETRPRNVSVLYCIKAYDVPVSAGTLNVSVLASEMALKTALADFTGTNRNFSSSGYQKLPGGLLIQWGEGLYGTDTLVSYPIVFPNNSLRVIIGAQNFDNGQASPNKVRAVTAYALTSSGFTASSASGVASNSSWIALGY